MRNTYYPPQITYMPSEIPEGINFPSPYMIGSPQELVSCRLAGHVRASGGSSTSKRYFPKTHIRASGGSSTSKLHFLEPQKPPKPTEIRPHLQHCLSPEIHFALPYSFAARLELIM